MAIDTDLNNFTAPFDELLGMEIVEVTAERAVVTLPVAEKLTQPYGIVHGGVYCSIAETAASIGAAFVAMEMGRSGAVGQSNHTDFLKATREGTLTGTATPVHVGRSVQLWQVEITDDAGTTVASAKVRMFNLD